MNLCKTCKCRCEKEYCFRHKLRKKIPQIRRFKTLSPLDNSKTTEKAKSSLLMKEFFLEVWNERPHKSEIFPFTFLGNEPLSTFFHHILPKGDFIIKTKCPEAKYDKENIILLLPEEHQRVHIDMERYDEINRRRRLLLVKYGLK